MIELFSKALWLSHQVRQLADDVQKSSNNNNLSEGRDVDSELKVIGLIEADIALTRTVLNDSAHARLVAADESTSFWDDVSLAVALKVRPTAHCK